MINFRGLRGNSSLTVAVIAVLASLLVLLFSSLGSGIGGGDMPQCPFAAPFTGSFVIQGSVLNSSFHNASSNATLWNASVNVSIYNMSFSAFGEPQTTFVNQTATSPVNGSFTLKVGPGNCMAMYTLKVVAYNVSSWNAWEVGPQLPTVPLSAMTAFLDNATLYLQPAATLNLTSVNSFIASSDNLTFNYVIFDDALGYPLAENFMTLVLNASLVVPRAKNYTVMMMRGPQALMSAGVSPQDMYLLATPPQTISVQNASNFSGTEFVINLRKNLSFGQYTISGNITTDGSNTTRINVTKIVNKLAMAGMVPPNSGIDMGGSSPINNTAEPGIVANYNLTVMGAASGIYQILEVYAENNSVTSSGIPETYGYFTNFTCCAEGSIVHNITLKRLAGNYSTATPSLNTSYVKINISDANGQPLQDAHVELTVDMVGHRSNFPTFRYMVDQLSDGTLSFSFLNDSNVTVLVFNRQYAPLKFKLNVTNASREPNGIIRITLNAFKPRQFQANGSAEDFSGGKAGNFRLTFMRNSDACNVFNASIDACRLFQNDFDAGAFNPLKVMASGKVNLLMEINTTGVKVYFIGVDMLASGPPDASMSENALKTSSNGTAYQELFKFGSMAPNIYDKVLVGIPYNYSRLDDSQQINFSIKGLFDENSQQVWNGSQTPNSSIPSEWSDYDTRWFNITNGGMPCYDSNGVNLTNATCFINATTNYVWISLPHFSDGEGGPSGGDTTAPAAPQFNINATINGNVMVNWTDVAGETGESYIIFRSASNISIYGNNLTNYSGINYIINITNLTTTRIGEGVQLYIDNTTLNGTRYFYAVAAVDATGNLQNSSFGINVSNSYNVTVNDTVAPLPTLNISGTPSDTTVTLTWLNVTRDIYGGADFYNLTYKIYQSGVNETNVNLAAINVTAANLSFAKSVSGSSNSTTISGLVRGTYHFAVTTHDDGGNENNSIYNPRAGPYGNYVNVSVTPTVPSSSSGSSSGGGGGGGGGVTAPSEGTKVSKMWASLPKGVAVMNITRTDMIFKKLTFTVVNSLSNAELAITKLDEKPTVKKDVQGTVYNNYLRVDKTNILDSDISSVKIMFSVEKKWFDQTGGLVKDIVLQRYANSEWTQLSTTNTGMDQTNQYFEAASPGFSIFAVTLKTKASASKSGTTTSDNEQGGVNVSGTGASTNESGVGAGEGAGSKFPVKLIIIAVLAVAIIGGGVFFVVKKGGFGSLLSKFRRGGGSRAARTKSSEEKEADEIVKKYESQRSRQDQRGRPPEAFN